VSGPDGDHDRVPSTRHGRALMLEKRRGIGMPIETNQDSRSPSPGLARRTPESLATFIVSLAQTSVPSAHTCAPSSLRTTVLRLSRCWKAHCLTTANVVTGETLFAYHAVPTNARSLTRSTTCWPSLVAHAPAARAARCVDVDSNRAARGRDTCRRLASFIPGQTRASPSRTQGGSSA